MRTSLDLSPLFRSTIGFDRLFDALEMSGGPGSENGWPPYDIIKAGEDDYRIELALAGFKQNELSITQEDRLLVVTGEKADDSKAEYLHHGIAAGSFRRTFELAEYVEVTDAKLVDGLLSIELKRVLPDAMKPRRIEIARGPAVAADDRRRIGTAKQAA